MEWSQVLGIVFGNAAMFLPVFLWLRTEANADRREANEDRRYMLNILNEMKEEMKEFHGRLISLEQRRK